IALSLFAGCLRCSLLCHRHLRHLHPFPTRRSSDLVHVDTLEQLMTMVSELVLTRNQLLDIVRRHEDSEFKGPLQRLSTVTAELRSEEHTSELQSQSNLVCRLLLEKKKSTPPSPHNI